MSLQYCKYTRLVALGKPYICSLSDTPCVYQRWCTAKRKYKLTDNNTGCLLAQNNEQQKGQ